MFTTIRRQPCPKAYTIIESLVVLVILAVFSMVVMALVIHKKEPVQPKGITVPNAAPADPSPPAATQDKPE
jgi:competence protein ComGC